MTIKQHTEAQQALEELKALAPTVRWAMTWNYYTKLPEYEAIKDGGVSFTMYRRDKYMNHTNEWGVTYPHYERTCVEMQATVNMTTHDSGTGFIVSEGLPKATVVQELPRVNFKKYVQFVKDNIGLLERIGA